MLRELDALDLEEDEAQEAFAVLEGGKRRSWAENRRLKQVLRKDRAGAMQAPERQKPSESGGKGQGKERKRLTVAELKLVSRCANCGQKGHWKAECRNPYRPREPRAATSAAAATGAASSSSHFTFAASPADSKGLMSWLSKWECVVFKEMVLQQRKRTEARVSSWVVLEAGVAIVDTGAAQDLIGLSAYKTLVAAWREKGIKPLRLRKSPRAASGIGGRAKALFVALLPVAFAGVMGTVEVTVLSEDIPHLLSAPFLTYLQAKIDMAANEMTLDKLQVQVKMKESSGGHRLVDVTCWQGSQFLLDSATCSQYGISPDALCLSPLARSGKGNATWCSSNDALASDHSQSQSHAKDPVASECPSHDLQEGQGNRPDGGSLSPSAKEERSESVWQMGVMPRLQSTADVRQSKEEAGERRSKGDGGGTSISTIRADEHCSDKHSAEAAGAAGRDAQRTCADARGDGRASQGSSSHGSAGDIPDESGNERVSGDNEKGDAFSCPTPSGDSSCWACSSRGCSDLVLVGRGLPDDSLRSAASACVKREAGPESDDLEKRILESLPSIPRHHTRTNLEGQPRSLLLGAYTRRGHGVSPCYSQVRGYTASCTCLSSVQTLPRTRVCQLHG